jgi:protein-tyrosine phosphatase
MIDYHCHLLYAVDDGPREIEESVEMALSLQKAGFTTVYCTPHMMKGVHEADNRQVTVILQSLQERLKRENIALRLFAGREYYLDEFIFEHLKNPLPLGETNFIMLEIPGNIPDDFIKQACFQIKRNGFTPMIAHPERGSNFANPEKKAKGGFDFFNSGKNSPDNDMLEYLIELGCAFQGNYGSFLGIYGQEPQNTAREMKRRGLYTHFGTDLHSKAGITYLNENLTKIRRVED